MKDKFQYSYRNTIIRYNKNVCIIYLTFINLYASLEEYKHLNKLGVRNMPWSLIPRIKFHQKLLGKQYLGRACCVPLPQYTNLYNYRFIRPISIVGIVRIIGWTEQRKLKGIFLL